MQSEIPVLREKKTRRKSSRRLLVILFLFFIILFVVLFFHSSLSKITIIEVTGISLTQEEAVRAAADLAEGKQYLTVDEQEAEQAIKRLDTVESVKVSKSFPGKVTVAIAEYPQVANERLADGSWVTILANGKSVSMAGKQGDPAFMNRPIISGWEAESELKAELASQLAHLKTEWLLDVSEILPNPSVSYPDRLLIYTRSGYEVVTTIGKLADKLPYLTGVVHELQDKGTEHARITMLEAITSESLDGAETDPSSDTDGEDAEQGE